MSNFGRNHDEAFSMPEDINQSMSSPMARIKSQLECPVCLNIPRELPVPSCPSGHIVCRPCKTRVKDCPTCRQPMPADMTNSLVGGLIDQVKHRCKYNDQGCEVKMMLRDLHAHERSCPERTVKCPYNTCGSIVKLKDMNEHFLSSPNPSSLPHSTSTFDHECYSSWPIVLRDGSLFSVKWKMSSMKVNDELFHIRLAYSQLHKCFALSVWSSPAGASNYRANLSIRTEEMDMSMNGLRITSVENVPSIDKCMEENGKYFWCIPFTLAKRFAIKEEEEESKLLHVYYDVRLKR